MGPAIFTYLAIGLLFPARVAWSPRRATNLMRSVGWVKIGNRQIILAMAIAAILWPILWPLIVVRGKL